MGVSNHQPHDCLLNRLFRRRWKKTSKLRVTGLCVGNSPGTGEFPAQMASNAENVSIWWCHHGCGKIRRIQRITRSFFTDADLVVLTHLELLMYWGLIMHICVGGLVSIDSGNNLAPVRTHVIAWTNADFMWSRHSGRYFVEIVKKNKDFYSRKFI